MGERYTIGPDYGTNSVRALVVRCANGKELGTHVYAYPGGKQGVLLESTDHTLARQHPGEYLAGLEVSVREALGQGDCPPASPSRWERWTFITGQQVAGSKREPWSK